MKRALLILTTLLGINLQAQTLADSMQVSTFAGNGVYGNTDGPGTSASFSNPYGVCTDKAGNVYVVDQNNFLIRKITPAGVVSTLAGSGSSGYINGTGNKASFGSVYGICCDSTGNVYLPDIGTGTATIRKITTAGIVTTFASLSISGFYFGICIDKTGSLYTTDGYSVIYKINTTGTVSVFAGSGVVGYQDATGTNAQFSYPNGICVDHSGNLFVADGGNQRIRKITPAGVVSTVAGSGTEATIDGHGTSASFDSPTGICIDAKGNLYVTEPTSNTVRKISSGGDVITIAGNGATTGGFQDDIGKKAQFGFTDGYDLFPIPGIASNSSGTLFVGDILNARIREIQQIIPKPPVITYNGINAHVCMGSALNYQPAITGGTLGMTLQVDSFYTGHQKGICKNYNTIYVLSTADSIMRFDYNGNYKGAINTVPNYLYVTNITADDSGRIYLAAPDQTNSVLSNIYRLTSASNNDFSFTSLPSGYISNVSAMRLGPDGKLYLADTNTATGATSGYITVVDTSSGSPSQISASTSNSFDIINGFTFGKNSQMFISDNGYKNILVSNNPASGNFYQYFSGLDTLKWKFHSIDIDTNGVGAVYLATANSVFALYRTFSAKGDTTNQMYDFKQLGVKLQKPCGVVTVPNPTGIPETWIADTNSNYVKRVAFYAYQITPPLPKGLSYDFVSGKITGTPAVATATQTYTITVNSQYGAKTSTLTFSVDPPSPLSGTPGTLGSKIVNQTDGLTVNYNDTNNCSKMLTIADSIAGGSPGFTQIKQTVYPTIATFGTGQFAPRVNQVNAQNPHAPAGLSMYFTYQDIVNFNTSNTSGQHLSNDTTTGTMQVAVLQLHKDSNGNIRAIPHSPIAAKWITADKDWEVDFAVTEFSTFYMGTTTAVTSFTCANSHTDSITTSNAYYLWQNKYDTLSIAGTYVDTLTNSTGCDSVCTLQLTFTPTGISTPLLAGSTKVYPNPSTGFIFVDINNPNIDATDMKITVTNILGEAVYSTTQSGHNLKLDLGGLQKGCYILNIVSKQETLNKRIVLE